MKDAAAPAGQVSEEDEEVYFLPGKY